MGLFCLGALLAQANLARAFDIGKNPIAPGAIAESLRQGKQMCFTMAGRGCRVLTHLTKAKGKTLGLEYILGRAGEMKIRIAADVRVRGDALCYNQPKALDSVQLFSTTGAQAKSSAKDSAASHFERDQLVSYWRDQYRGVKRICTRYYSDGAKAASGRTKVFAVDFFDGEPQPFDESRDWFVFVPKERVLNLQ